MNLMQASREYAKRPADERFASVADLVTSAQADRDGSKEVNYNLRDLTLVPMAVPGSDSTVAVQGPKGLALFSHWAYSQLCRTLRAPAEYVRSLSPQIASDALNYGIDHAPNGTAVSMLVKAPNGNPLPMIRACTSDSYSRLWDGSLYDDVKNTIMQHDSRWTTPPTWTGEPAGAYRGDRDSFLILVNGGSIVNDPSLRDAQSPTPPGTSNVDPGGMYRGIMVRNSEVGAAAVSIQRILFRYICGNHIIWDAVIDKSFRRRHVGSSVQRDVTREIANIAHTWANASAAKDDAIIRMLIDRELASSEKAVIDELRAIGFSKEQAEGSYRLCVEKESASPRSFWGLAQGATRLSQESGYQNDRLELDQLAAKVLARGARQLVTA